MNEGNSWIVWPLALGLIWAGYSFLSPDKVSEPEYRSKSMYSKTEKTIQVDGYTWAEDNGVSTFGECQDQFGEGYEEDECNRYVKENHSGYETFNGYDCTEDCSGHEAGYSWAEENDISDEYDCDGNSNSFNEGCISYVEENY